MKLKCTRCNREIHRKPSRMKKLKLAFCGMGCWREHLANHPFEQRKEELIQRHREGEMIKDLAREVGVGIKALGWRFRKWGVRTRRSYEYGEVIAVLNSISKQRGVEAKKNYLENYKNGKIAWQQAHKMARYVWGITDKPCQACGWDRAERDMHLIEPRLLVKENAVSLCPNCHRLWHGGLINKSHLKI